MVKRCELPHQTASCIKQQVIELFLWVGSCSPLQLVEALSSFAKGWHRFTDRAIECVIGNSLLRGAVHGGRGRDRRCGRGRLADGLNRSRHNRSHVRRCRFVGLQGGLSLRRRCRFRLWRRSTCENHRRLLFLSLTRAGIRRSDRLLCTRRRRL
jgi:hypothetical protein